MQQKVALTAAHLLSQGRIADMGMGSGTGSDSLAALYPGLDVVGVDVSPQIVEIASARYQRPNLSFRLGDIATRVFEDGSLDAILDSSVLHHVTSFNGYDRDAARRALEAQVAALADHGVLIVRDFVDPGPGDVLLELRTDDADGDGDDPRSCSTAKLFERFTAEFRSLSSTPGCTAQPEDGAPTGWTRFRTTRTLAVEFLLRKDYRRDWETEIKEEYTYLTQAQFEHVYAELGLRVLASTPIRNPWIVRNRFVGKFRLFTDEGTRDDEFPATNYLIVGERVPAGAGVRIEERPTETRLDYLNLAHYTRRDTGLVMDVVSRPHLTVDAVPWFEFDHDVFVLARMSYPRPILRATGSGVSSIEGSRAPDYITEPITVVSDDAPLGQTIEDALWARAGIEAKAIVGMNPGHRYFPSAGGLREEVRSMFVELQPTFTSQPQTPTGFSDAGRIGAIEARQLLRAAAVGGLPDARLELNVYSLLRRMGRAPGPWIGEAIELPASSADVEVEDPDQLADRPTRRLYDRCEPTRSSGFLELRCADFVEFDSAGNERGSKQLEYVRPTRRSANTVAVAVLLSSPSGVLIGLDDDDLPAAQSIDGNSNLCVTPAWRLPQDVAAPEAAKAWVRVRLQEELGVDIGDAWWLGGRYHPSPGATPEVVHPLAVSVDQVSTQGLRALRWVRLAELVECDALLRDGHLRIVTERSHHALSGGTHSG